MENIYKKLPPVLQDVMISVYGYKLMKRRYGPQYWKWLTFFKEKDYSDIHAEEANQLQELKEFLNYVNLHSKFYMDLFKDIDPDTIDSLEKLKELPVVDKEMLRSSIEDVYTIEEKNAYISYTGGTTGKSLKVRVHPPDSQKRMAYLDAFKYRVGIEQHKVRKATFSGRSLIYSKNTRRFWRTNYPYRQRLYSTFHLSEENLPYYLKNLNSYKPEVINGFVSAIYEIASYVIRNEVQLSFVPKAIFTTSETLTDHHRSVIEEAFQSKVYNQYASAEGAPFITECKNGNLHYNLDTGVIEINDDNEMIVTSFTSHGTPLVRYNIGDTLEWMEGTCNCGNSHPLVKSISGRKVDFLFDDQGNKVSLSHLADVIKGIPNSITQMQFVQESKGEIKVYFSVDESLFVVDQREIIMKEMRYRFGNEMSIELIQKSHIPKEKSGKYSLIKNLIADA